jgi:hypothetical protein
LADKIKMNKMDGACSMYGAKVHTESWLGTLVDRGHLENLCVDGEKSIQMVFQETEFSQVWIYQV